MMFLAGAFGSNLPIPPFFDNIVIPAILGGIILAIILERVLNSWGYTLW